jgi:hypothetical protein
MRIKGAIHVHSILSGDGTMSIAELADFYRRHGYQFIAMTEHAEDLDVAGADAMMGQSRENSRNNFCVVPGLEFSSHTELHILGLGITLLYPQDDRLAVVEHIHAQGGLAILAHPRRCGWNCPEGILQAIDAIEIWNVGYDGKFLPSAKAFAGFAAMRKVNPKLLGVVGHDLHRRESFYDVAVEMDVPSLSAETILENLRGGSFWIRSRFFRAGPSAELSLGRATCLRIMSDQLRNIRRARSLALGRLS